MKKLKEEILQAVQDATDLTDNIVSIPILSHFLDGILKEQLPIQRVSQAKQSVCPDCGDTGEIRNDKEEIIRSCPCHYC